MTQTESIKLTQSEIESLIEVMDRVIEEEETEEGVKDIEAILALLNQGLHQQDAEVAFTLDNDFKSYVIEEIDGILYEGMYPSFLDDAEINKSLKSVDDKYRDAMGYSRGVEA